MFDRFGTGKETDLELGWRVPGDGRSRKVAVYAILALAALVAIGTYGFFSGSFEGYLSKLLGPPQVTLQETYADSEGTATFDHSGFQVLLREHVDEHGWVDYGKLKAQSDQLAEYLAAIAEANVDEFGRDERLAFLINAYNAFTLQLIIENYPLKSIKDISAAQRWDAVRWNLGGQTVSLNQMEHELIRPNFKEPRIHFALVCAAVGCPPLRNEVYTAEKLETQLADQSNYVHSHATWMEYNRDDKRLKLTQLYKWYGGDFEQVAGSVEAYVARYNSGLKADLDAGNRLDIEWLQYDWDLNDVVNKSAR